VTGRNSKFVHLRRGRYSSAELEICIKHSSSSIIEKDASARTSFKLDERYLEIAQKESITYRSSNLIFFVELCLSACEGYLATDGESDLTLIMS
jgi:hypothetical protein